MDKLGRQITMEENCGLDFHLGNPIVNQAYTAFIAYKPIYTASCLKSASGSYCQFFMPSHDRARNVIDDFYLQVTLMR